MGGDRSEEAGAAQRHSTSRHLLHPVASFQAHHRDHRDHRDHLDSRQSPPRSPSAAAVTPRLTAALAAGGATCVAGFVVVYITWARVAATTEVHEQLAYLASGAPAGLALVLLGTVGLSMAARRTAASRTRGVRPFLLDLAGGLLVAAGLGVLLSGWQGVARTDVVHDQVSYLASALPTGLALVVVGAGLISIATDRALGARRLAEFDDLVAAAVRSATPSPQAGKSRRAPS